MFGEKGESAMNGVFRQSKGLRRGDDEANWNFAAWSCVAEGPHAAGGRCRARRMSRKRSRQVARRPPGDGRAILRIDEVGSDVVGRRWGAPHFSEKTVQNGARRPQ